MGACSSKPKTTEFEGSIEPRKPTDVAADQPHDTERSSEAVQMTPEPDTCKDEGSPKEVLSRSAEGTSEGQNDVLGEKVVVQKEANDKLEQKESKADGVSDEVVQKNDLGGGVENCTSVNVNGADAKTCEDKAVVSEETGGHQGDAAYVDKTVPPDEEKAAETPEKRNIIVPEDDASSMLEFADSAGVESPITGVVQAVEPMKDSTNEEDVSKNVTTESVVVSAHEDSQDDSKVRAESPATGAGDVDVGVMATVLAVAREVPREGIEASGVEILASGVEILAPTNAVETLAPAEADPVKNGDEGASQPQGEAPSDAVIDLSPSSKIDAEECPTDTKAADVPLDECVVNQTEGIHASAVGDGGSADTMETETPKKIGSADSEVSIIESKIEDALEESVKDKDGQMSDGQSHALAAEMNGDRGPTGESISDQIQEPTGEAEKEAAHKLHVEHTSGDAPFEDASDAPLKSEAGKSIESGHVPS